MSTPTSLTHQLAGFADGLTYDELPAAVRDKARLVLAHGLGMALAAYGSPYGEIALAVARRECAGQHGAGGATLFVDGDRVTPTAAAFANGVLLHGRTQEDALGPIHLGPAILPVALAAAEIEGAGGRAVLAAIAAGYEVAAAVANTTVAASTARGFRSSPLYGVFGAATAAGKLLGLDQGQLATALGYAASFAFGTLETARAGTMEWRFQVGQAGRTGLLAAYLAREGAEAAPGALEGPLGFYHGFIGSVPDEAQVSGALGRRFALLDVLVKPFPGCVYVMAPVTALLDVMEAEGLAPGSIEQIAVELNDYDANYPGMQSRGPFPNPAKSLGSLYFCVAAASLDGRLSSQSQQRYQDEDVRAQMWRVELREQRERPTLTSRLIVTAGGTTYEREVDGGQRYASLSLAEERKLLARLQSEMPVGPEQIAALVDEVEALASRPNVQALISLLVRPATAGRSPAGEERAGAASIEPTARTR